MARQDSAEVLALQALAWLLSDPGLAGQFLAACGADPAQLAARAGDPAFLGGVLDFLLEDDARIIAFCDAQVLPYGVVQETRAKLPGGQQWHWT